MKANVNSMDFITDIRNVYERSVYDVGAAAPLLMPYLVFINLSNVNEGAQLKAKYNGSTLFQM